MVSRRRIKTKKRVEGLSTWDVNGLIGYAVKSEASEEVPFRT